MRLRPRRNPVPDAAPAAVVPAGAGPTVDLSVVVPAYNESARLGRTLSAINTYLCAGSQSWELVVVDDGSTDDTAAIVEEHGTRDPRVRLVRLPANRGKGHAVRVGVLSSRGRAVLMCDADLSTPIECLEVLREALVPGVAVAIGSRGMATSTIEVHQGRLRETLGRLGNLAIRVLAVRSVVDTQCGFKLFDGAKGRAAFSRARVDGWGFDIEVLFICRRLGWTIAERPVTWAHAEGSRLRARAYLEVLAEVVRMRWWHRGGRLRPVVDRPPGEVRRPQDPSQPPAVPHQRGAESPVALNRR